MHDEPSEDIELSSSSVSIVNQSDDTDPSDDSGGRGSRPASLRQTGKSATSTSVKRYPNNEDGNFNLRQRKKPTNSASPSSIFLRSVGLKVLSSHKRQPFRRRKRDVAETPKEVESRSFQTALLRSGVHILPVVTTIFVICFNAIGFLNGPEITATATFFLQLVSKFHELAIVASLGVIALEVVRHHLLNGGINFGLLSSKSSFATLSWLWSPDFLSTFTAPIPQRSKLLLISILTLCCLLAATVGPSSALLFVPTQLWLPSASTDFYVAGTEEQLHPTTLTARDSGPEYCKHSPLRSSNNGQCLYAGWATLYDQMTQFSPVRPGWQLFLPASASASGLAPRIMAGTAPDQNYNYSMVSDSFARTITAVTARNMGDLDTAHGISWGFAKGRNRRLRDFIGGGGGYALTWDKFPVTRTVCSDHRVIENDSTTLPFPVLARDAYWRNGLSTGLIQEVEMSELIFRKGWEGLKPLNLSHSQVRTEFVPLPSSFGNSTSGGMIFISQDTTGKTPVTLARGCTIDARWSEGENLSKQDSFLFSMESQMGKQPPPQKDEYKFTGSLWYFDESYRPYYGPTLNMTKEWFDGWIVPMPEQTRVGSNFTQTNFEALLNQSRLNAPAFTNNTADDSRILLEYFIGIFITDALSRIGWELQTETPTSNKIKPLLRYPPEITDDSFLNGVRLWDPPPFPHVTRHYHTYKYGTAWYLNDPGQWIALVILGVHLLMALVHSVIMLWTRKTSDAWDSTNELVALAYNSRPHKDVLANCSGGITSIETLEKVVRVGEVVDEYYGDARLELVFCDQVRNRLGVRKVVPGEKYS